MSGGSKLETDADVDDVQDNIDEDACLALTGDAEQCGNNLGTDASDERRGLCGVHAGTDRPRVTDFDEPAWVGLRDELLDLFVSERDAYALATISPDVVEVWRLVTALDDVMVGQLEYTTTRLCGLARDLADHPELEVDDHPLGVGGCIALQGSGAKNHSCVNSAYGSSLLCGTHSDAELRGTVLDEGEPGPDLDSVTVAGDEFLLVEQRGADLIVVDPDRYELRRLEGAAGLETRWDDQEITPSLSDDADRLVLVGCGDAKADDTRPAEDLYTSNYFDLKRRYAEQNGDEWAILSAKYGLLDPGTDIEPYDLTVDDVDVDEWVISVLSQLPDVRDTEVVILAGPDYADVLEGDLFMYGAEVDIPGEGKKIGQRMSWLSEQLDAGDADDRDDDRVQIEDQDELAERPPLLEGIDEDDRVKVTLEDGRAYNGTVSDIGTGAWDTDPDEIDLTIYVDVDASVGMFRDDLLSIETNRDAEGDWSEIVAYDCAIGSEWDETRKRIDLVEDLDEEGALFSCEDCDNIVGPVMMRVSRCIECGGDMAVATDGGDGEDDSEPEPPEDLPKYLREGLQKQSADDLRSIATFADELADHLEDEAQEELEEQSDQDVDETPEEWDEDEWDEQLDEAMEKGEVPESKGTLTTKEIDGRSYYYLQWREGDSVKSQYVAPVTPSGDS